MNYARYRSNLFYLIVCIALVLGSFGLEIAGMDYATMDISFQYILILLPVILYVLLTRQKFKKVLRLNKVNPLQILIAFLLAIVSHPIIGLIDVAMQNVIGTGGQMQIPMGQSYGIWVSLFVIALTPAICEEVFMRGAVLSGHRNVKLWKAAILNGVLFGLFHNNFGQLFYATAFGIILTFVVVLTNSIYPSIVMHFIMNGLSVLMDFYPNSTYVKFTTWYEYNLAVLIPLGVISLAAVVGLLIWLKKISGSKKEQEPIKEADEQIPAELTEINNNSIAYPEWPLLMATAISITYSLIYT